MEVGIFVVLDILLGVPRYSASSSDAAWKSYKELHYVEFLRTTKLQKLQKIKMNPRVHELKLHLIADQPLFNVSLVASSHQFEEYTGRIIDSLNKHLLSSNLRFVNWSSSAAPPQLAHVQCQDLLRALLHVRSRQPQNEDCYDLSCLWVFLSSAERCPSRAIPDSICTKRSVAHLPYNKSDSSVVRQLLLLTLDILGMHADAESTPASTLQPLYPRTPNYLLWCLNFTNHGDDDDDGDFIGNHDLAGRLVQTYEHNFAEGRPPFNQECGNAVVERSEQCDDDDEEDDGRDQDRFQVVGVARCCDLVTCLEVDCKVLIRCCLACKEETASNLSLQQLSACYCEDGLEVTFSRCLSFGSEFNRSTLSNGTACDHSSDDPMLCNFNVSEIGKVPMNDHDAKFTDSTHVLQSTTVTTTSISLFVATCGILFVAFVIYFLHYNRRIHRKTSKTFWPKRSPRSDLSLEGNRLEPLRGRTPVTPHKATTVSFGKMPSYRHYKFQSRFGMETDIGDMERPSSSGSDANALSKAARPERASQLPSVPGKGILRKTSVPCPAK